MWKWKRKMKWYGGRWQRWRSKARARCRPTYRIETHFCICCSGCIYHAIIVANRPTKSKNYTTTAAVVAAAACAKWMCTFFILTRYTQCGRMECVWVSEWGNRKSEINKWIELIWLYAFKRQASSPEESKCYENKRKNIAHFTFSRSRSLFVICVSRADARLGV